MEKINSENPTNPTNPKNYKNIIHQESCLNTNLSTIDSKIPVNIDSIESLETINISGDNYIQDSLPGSCDSVIIPTTKSQDKSGPNSKEIGKNDCDNSDDEYIYKIVVFGPAGASIERVKKY